MRTTRKITSSTYRGARKVAQTTGKVARTTGKVVRTTGKVVGAGYQVARNAINEIPTWHEIKSGDTLYRIGKFYGVPTEELKILNPLIDPLKLKIGQYIRLRR